MPKKHKFGLLARRYKYYLNPYPKLRFSKCPICEGKTGQSKVPLIIHVDPKNLIALGYTHRYCPKCDALIGHKHEIESLLFDLFSRLDPGVIGNSYVFIGTMETEPWRKSLDRPIGIDEMLPHIHDMKAFQELRMKMAGWFPEGQEPPVKIPPKSKLWVKQSMEQYGR